MYQALESQIKWWFHRIVLLLNRTLCTPHFKKTLLKAISVLGMHAQQALRRKEREEEENHLRNIFFLNCTASSSTTANLPTGEDNCLSWSELPGQQLSPGSPPRLSPELKVWLPGLTALTGSTLYCAVIEFQPYALGKMKCKDEESKLNDICKSL